MLLKMAKPNNRLWLPTFNTMKQLLETQKKSNHEIMRHTVRLCNKD